MCLINFRFLQHSYIRTGNIWCKYISLYAVLITAVYDTNMSIAFGLVVSSFRVQIIWVILMEKILDIFAIGDFLIYRLNRMSTKPYW